jgi:ABC-type multidrug transport system ATPase subunit
MAHEQGITTLISSHNLDEIAAICSDFGILHRGNMLFSGNISEVGGRIALIRSTRDNDELLSLLRHHIICSRRDNRQLEVIIADKDDAVVSGYLRHNASRFEVEKLTLKQFFVYMTSQEDMNREDNT